MTFTNLPKVKQIVCSGNKEHDRHSYILGEHCNKCGCVLIEEDQDLLIAIKMSNIDETFYVPLNDFAKEFIKEFITPIFSNITNALQSLQVLILFKDERVGKIEREITNKFSILNIEVEKLSAFLKNEKENNLPKKRNF